MDQKPKRAIGVRVVALSLWLISMPLTLLDSDGPGWFVDSDGWQGYEIVFFWPIITGDWRLILLVAIPTAYVVGGMWFRLPMWIHFSAWAISLLTLTLWLVGYRAYPAFSLFALAWILSGIGPLLDWHRGVESDGRISPPASNPAAASESPRTPAR
jgi:hypothetical protein